MEGRLIAGWRGDSTQPSPIWELPPLQEARPSKIAAIAFSIRAVRVADCFAPVKWNR
jgi:hypothetical protein